MTSIGRMRCGCGDRARRSAASLVAAAVGKGGSLELVPLEEEDGVEGRGTSAASDPSEPPPPTPPAAAAEACAKEDEDEDEEVEATETPERPLSIAAPSPPPPPPPPPPAPPPLLLRIPSSLPPLSAASLSILLARGITFSATSRMRRVSSAALTAPCAPRPSVAATTYWFAKVTPASVSTWRTRVSRTPSGARVACAGSGGWRGGVEEEVGGGGGRRGGGAAAAAGSSSGASSSSASALLFLASDFEVWRSREDQASFLLPFFDELPGEEVEEEGSALELVLLGNEVEVSSESIVSVERERNRTLGNSLFLCSPVSSPRGVSSSTCR